ncbi:ABC transporter ATP-binding protein [Mesobacillus selenatarsenatis]|uniref:ABC-type tungstate transport system, ATP-binding protein n=1 Tax=Mesobacillus selenatarsenatis (strain DSM 18680 / JCM 14380 / FERM P-15431 / SF-1) TaxID=1321606 RepID=A0A0A8X310_MESS1|nr:ABC transporter ATP-binding protein [Mesobacillus selenatarsenatis]GAM14318.1 ABC-type tungstate transport system, ATP-binding protein [Mesobacillus selenatarsenatis SF-1]
MITAKNLEVRAGKKVLLSIPHFELQEGEVLGIMGPNGAGKSTFIKALALLEKPSQGTIFLKGKDITNDLTLDMRRRFAVAMQQPLLLDTTVFQNVAVGLKLRKLPRQEVKQKVAYWLEKFQISSLAKKHGANLSGGEAQRVNLARAMVLEPEVLFLDEPFSALDFPTKVQLLKDIKSIIQQTNTTTVFVSHDLMELKFLADTLAILMDGDLKQTGPTEEVLASPNSSTSGFINDWQSLLN